MIDFKFHKEEDTFVVWVAGINRYVQLLEPAFRVFELWAYGLGKNDIVNRCALQYSLSETESARFVDEITAQSEALFDAPLPKNRLQTKGKLVEETPGYFSDHTYQIGNRFFRFIFRSEYLEHLFHPLFRHQETGILQPESTCFDIFTTGEGDAFRVNDRQPQFYTVDETDALQGAVYMEILNVIHGKYMHDWLGVLHASAVTDGQRAVIFAAPSGSGKSSIALLMMAEGYKLLSDDFVPVCLEEPEVYHFPSGISVKPGISVSILQKITGSTGPIHSPGDNEEEIYLPPKGESGLLASVRASAIVFVQYDPTVVYELKRESNLSVMNQLIRQSWIAGTAEAAERFMAWYFNLPVYTLRYSDNRKAVEGVGEIFENKRLD